MNKKQNSILIICLLFTIIIFMIFNSNTVIESVGFSISIWKDNLFPTLFPFFVINNLLIEYGFVEIIGSILAKPMNKFFNMPSSTGSVLAISLFTGFPSGAKYTTDLVKRGIITKDVASRLLTFTHYSNPLFILGLVSFLLNSKLLAIIILISHISSGLLTGYIYNHRYSLGSIEKPVKRINITNKAFGELLTNSVIDSLNTLFLLLGIITIFLVITTLINQTFNFNPSFEMILSGIFEMTQGIKLVSLSKISELLKIVLITFFISFGGLSVHMQVISVINEQKIKYKPFLIARIMHSVISIGFVFILYNLVY